MSFEKKKHKTKQNKTNKIGLVDSSAVTKTKKTVKHLTAADKAAQAKKGNP